MSDSPIGPAEQPTPPRLPRGLDRLRFWAVYGEPFVPYIVGLVSLAWSVYDLV
ncbi:hypothetical protein ACFVMC_32900 [Nocardia sp. NPDC127579]|uniref:hypothetical protein n=1 Tax=Nocardia sp. NPDC127579 TaxID=3345402 RepID=UPI00363CCDDC